MTVLQRIHDLLEEGWETDRPTRTSSLPEPEFLIEQDERKVMLSTRDAVVVKDGGPQGVTPNGLGWTNEEVVTRVDVELRSMDRRVGGERVDGRVRLFGESDDPLDDGGLTGEVRAILNPHRSGLWEFDLVRTTTVNDVSNTMGKNSYRAIVELELTELARSLQ